MNKRSLATYFDDLRFLEGSPDFIRAALERSIEDNTYEAKAALIVAFKKIESAAARCAEYQANLLPSIYA